MKNKVLLALLVVILAVFVLGAVAVNNKTTEGYLRIHIRANSNSEADQNIKYEVKEKVSEFLEGAVSGCQSASEAMKIVSANLGSISSISRGVLRQRGFNYGARAKLVEEYFPTRSYDSLVLENGLYDALIIELGAGEGDNWWCVVYPPLCFKKSGSDQIIKSIFKK